MTREEALQYIDGLRCEEDFPYTDAIADFVKERNEAIDMAIEALTLEEYGLTCTTCADRSSCIMSAPDGRWKACENYRPLGEAVEHDGCDGCQYEPCGEDEFPCTECCQNYTDEYTPKKDLVEVVRCADCKYKYPKDMDMFCRFFIGGPLMDSGYCSRGERK